MNSELLFKILFKDYLNEYRKIMRRANAIDKANEPAK